MPIDVYSDDARTLRSFIPISTLSVDKFKTLCANIDFREAPKGSVLFKQGATDNLFVYLLEGAIVLQAGGIDMETIKSGSDTARFALAHQIPRKVSAVAKTKVRYFDVPAKYLTVVREKVAYEVSDIPEEASGDWMTTLLKSTVFQQLPAANLQKILMGLEEVDVKKGERIIQQDAEADYYYILKHGNCELTRKPYKTAKEVKLAQLKPCDTFGEDGIISGEPRNGSITMLSDGVVLRLAKAKFLQLIKNPIIRYIDYQSARNEHQQGAVYLDVRPPDAFEKKHLKGSTNTPFFSMRMQIHNYEHQQEYIVIDETGNLSEAAAFLLIRHAYNAVVLRGGLNQVPREDLVFSASSARETYATAEQSAAGCDDGEASSSPLFTAMDTASSPESPGDAESAEDAGDILTLDENDEYDETDEGIDAFARSFVDADFATSENEDSYAALEEENARLHVELNDSLQQIERLTQDLAAQKGTALGNDDAEQRISALNTEIAELQGIVKEYYERDANDNALSALKAELETVRSQADSDIAALQAELDQALADIKIHRKQIDEEQNRNTKLQLEVQRHVLAAAEQADLPPPQHGRPLWISAVLAILIAIFSVVLAAGIGLGSADGRDFLQSLLTRYAQSGSFLE